MRNRVPQCYEDCPLSDTFCLGCGHRTCNECWREYLKSKVTEGTSCISTECNYYKCSLLVRPMVFEQFLEPELLQRYQTFILKSYVSSSKNVIWCPARDCMNAVKYDGGK
eukprot:TRINITY_DN16152_c0_g1_i1.p1 TRINITY_DN16152_c0_g1~~TRINITY_DN16152_c0_g1_i1.p1  ORF type:complete len:110 (+),score=3.78 TRINITY_DN16152_c0_g1_i1:209-538(+)